MNIRNLTTFLASSVLTVSAATVTAHPAVDLNQYNNLYASQIATQTYKATNLSGEFVTMVPSAAFTQAQVQQSKPYGSDHFSLVDHFQGRRACTVFLDQNGLANPKLSSTSNLFNLVDRQSYMYSIIAHEMSHCLGLTERDDQRFYQQAIAQNSNLDQYQQALKSFSNAMHEVYADLHAVMLGASKTGDWTVLDQYLIAEKTQGFNPNHASLMAVVDLVDSIDPSRLRGMNFNQINNISNTLFKRFATDASGTISMNSRAGQNILREWYATGLETKTYLRAYAEPTPSSEAVQQWIEFHRQFAEQVIGAPALKDRDALNKLYGIKAYSLTQQNQLLKSTGYANQGAGASLYRMNENRLTNLHTIIREADRLHYGQGNSLQAHQGATAKWLRQLKNHQASAILSQELPRVMAEALMPETNDYQNQRIQQAQSNIRQQFGQAMSNSHIEYTSGNGERKEVRINPIQKAREVMSGLNR